MEQLFSEASKKQNTKSKFTQGPYNFLDNSNWEIAHEVRSILQNWADDFVPDKAFLSSFKTDEHFLSHYFELFIWKYFTTLGLKLEKTDRNPDTTVPDFLCSNQNLEFYLECTSIKFNPKQIQNQILDSIEQMNLPSVGLRIDFLSSSNKTPSIRRINRHIHNQLSQSADSFVFNEGDWLIQFETYPKNMNIKKNIFSIHDAEDTNKGYVNLKNGILKKSKMNYDTKSKPFVLAINTNDVFLEEDDFLRILFGKFEGESSFLHSSSEESIFLSRNNTPRNSHISAVLISNNLTAWNMDSCKFSLWHNPNATTPFLPPTDFCDSFSIQQALIIRNKGVHPSTHLNLTKGYYNKIKKANL